MIGRSSWSGLSWASDAGAEYPADPKDRTRRKSTQELVCRLELGRYCLVCVVDSRKGGQLSRCRCHGRCRCGARDNCCGMCCRYRVSSPRACVGGVVTAYSPVVCCAISRISSICALFLVLSPQAFLLPQPPQPPLPPLRHPGQHRHGISRMPRLIGELLPILPPPNCPHNPTFLSFV